MSIAWIIVVGLMGICFMLLMANIWSFRKNKELESRLKEYSDDKYKMMASYQDKITYYKTINGKLVNENSELRQVLFDVRERIRSFGFENNG